MIDVAHRSKNYVIYVAISSRLIQLNGVTYNYVNIIKNYSIGKYIVDICKLSNNLQGGINNRFVN